MARPPRRRSGRAYRKREKPAACPFCEKKVPRPKPVEDSVGVLGGCCECGAIFVADETGRGGGQAIVDGLTLLCGGDIDRAMGLLPGVDYELKDYGYRTRTHSIEPYRPGRGRSFGVPRLFFFLQNTEKTS